jgi:hypothetical protein
MNQISRYGEIGRHAALRRQCHRHLGSNPSGGIFCSVVTLIGKFYIHKNKKQRGSKQKLEPAHNFIMQIHEKT